MTPRRPAIAAFFLLLGVPFCGYLWLAAVLGNMVTGLSEGPVASGPIAPATLIIPFALYFSCGAASALSTRVSARKWFALVGHLMPFVFIPFFNGAEVMGLGMLTVCYGIFAVGWVRMICNENSRLYQLTARRDAS